MRRSIARLSLMVVLALLLALCLLAMAGPALAGSPFEGNPPLWGGHDFNAKMYVVGDGPESSAECLSVSSDPRASGTLLLWFDGDWVDIGDHAHVYGHWSLSNPATGGTGQATGRPYTAWRPPSRSPTRTPRSSRARDRTPMRATV